MSARQGCGGNQLGAAPARRFTCGVSGLVVASAMDVGVEIQRALRRLARAPAFSIAATLTIALSLAGLGALASMWNTLVVRGQPGIGHPDRMLWVRPPWTQRPRPYPTLEQHQALVALQPRSMDVAFYSPRIRPVKVGTDAAQRVGVQAVSGEYFRVLEAPLAAGRGLADSTVTARPAVVSWRFWKDQMHGDPGVLGRLLTVGSDTNYVVSGVAAEGFTGPEGLQQADVWVSMDRLTAWGSGRWLARMRSGLARSAAMREAQAELAALWPQIAVEPSARGVRLGTPSVEPLRGGLHPENVRSAGLIVGSVAAICLLTLLIATANLASLVLTRAVSRERDLAVKRAIGARARDVVAEPILEVVALFAIACAIGIVLARPVGAGLVAALNAPFPFVAKVHWDLPTIATTAVLALTAAVLCAVGPSLRMMRTDPGSVLRVDAGAARIGVAGRRLQSGFIVVQLFTAFLLVGASATVALQAWSAVVRELGVPDPSSVIVTYLPPSQGSRAERARRAEEYLEKVRAASGARQAAFAYASPGENRLLRTVVSRTSDRSMPARINIVSPSYFGVIGARVTMGRSFGEADVSGSAQVAVLSRGAAARLFESGGPVGSLVTIGTETPYQATIVGVVDDVTYEAESAGEPVLYVVADQFDPALGREIAFVRVAAPAASVRRIDSVMRMEAPMLAVRPALTLAQLLDDATRGERSLVTLAFACMILTITIAVIGVFGLVSDGVQQRRRETAVRLALGATAGRVTWSHAASSLGLALIALVPGVIIGSAAVALLAPVLGGLIDHVAVAAAMSAAIVLLATASASVLAVRLTASFNPAVLLRAD